MEVLIEGGGGVEKEVSGYFVGKEKGHMLHKMEKGGVTGAIDQGACVGVCVVV